MNIVKLSLGPMAANCYIVYQNKEALIFDPGESYEEIIRLIKQLNVEPNAIFLTHAHFDHIGAVDEIRDAFNIDVYLHGLEFDWLENPMRNGSQLFGVTEPLIIRKPDKELVAGKMQLGSFTFEVRHTPGHSPGSVSFLFQNFIIVGDTLFHGGIGRTDLPGGNYNQLMNAIKNHILTLPNEMVVYPGHGVETTVEVERTSNPFLN